MWCPSLVHASAIFFKSPLFNDVYQRMMLCEKSVQPLSNAEVNISSRNQYFCTCPKMALHGFPGRLSSWTVILLHEAQKRQYFCTGSPKKFSVHNWKRTSLNLQCIRLFCFLYHDIRDHLSRGEYFSEKPIFFHIPQKWPCTGIQVPQVPGPEWTVIFLHEA